MYAAGGSKMGLALGRWSAGGAGVMLLGGIEWRLRKGSRIEWRLSPGSRDSQSSPSQLIAAEGKRMTRE